MVLDAACSVRLRPWYPAMGAGRMSTIRRASSDSATQRGYLSIPSVFMPLSPIMFFPPCMALRAELQRFQLQDHAALGAIAGMVLLHFGVHRTGVNRFSRCGRCAGER